MRRHLWWIVFIGLVGGSYLYLQQGAPAGTTFRWAMLWAPASELPPSDRLALYMDRDLEGLFGPLEVDFSPLHLKDVPRLAAEFHAASAKAPRSHAAIYEAAIIVADGLAAGLEKRRQATLALAQAHANTLSFRDPLTGRMTENRSFLETQLKTAWTADAALRRQRLEQWYATLKQRERAERLYGLIGG